MSKRQTMNGTFTAIGAVVLLVLTLLAPAFSQDTIVRLSDPAFGPPRRPAVPFRHDEHNDKASIGDCGTCHHVYKDGKLVPDEYSIDQKCSDCHKVAPTDGSVPLMKAYHSNCKACHLQRKAGPVTCGECHPRSVRQP